MPVAPASMRRMALRRIASRRYSRSVTFVLPSVAVGLALVNGTEASSLDKSVHFAQAVNHYPGGKLCRRS
jgi:hypothetical protein